MIFNSAVMHPAHPVIDFIDDKGDVIAQYTGTSIDIPDVVAIENYGGNSFYIWVKGSCGVRFTYVPRNAAIDICCVGHGGKGGDPTSTHDLDNNRDINTGGAGGKGGQVVSKFNIAIWPSFWVDCVVEDTTYVRYGTAAWGATTGGGSNGGAGGTYTKGTDFEAIVDPSAGSQGTKPFGDNPLYYAPGGGGAKAAPESGYAAPGDTQGTPGTGGHGRSSMSDPVDEGRKGIVLIRTHTS